ncbi:hypothetical protein [Actinomycetospora sp. NBRC 106378]|uniref:hypothetical protein n=1 Tax=Actinomycetospora sp. NBRC 106378 TaxID=3032208 RepID=UPI0024A3240A|nr:hypothetical protein [Actinomycetospora sp. NBRC 106378]GLZ50739.1 hypothetical protein Acsp07_03560 [Actinomycetospora sp. NBRC 106378]
MSPARVAAASGIAFVALFAAAMVLLDRAPHLDAPDAAYAAFYAGGGDTLVVAIGLYLVPLAGIAFLWHLTAIRALLDTLTPRPSGMAHGLNLLAGVVFVTMLFAGTAALGAIAFATSRGSTVPPDPTTARALTALGYGLVFVFAVRGAGMFVLTTTTLLRVGGVLRLPWAVVGWLLGAFLLLAATNDPAALLVLPAWVLLIAVALLRHRSPADTPDPTPTVVEH